MSKLMLMMLAAAVLAVSGCANRSGSQAQVPESTKTPDAISTFESVRKEEIALAERVRGELSNTFQGGKNANKAIVEPLALTQTAVTDKTTGRSQNVTTFDSLTFVMPLSLRRTPVADQVNSQIRNFANKLADDRGASQILFNLKASDAKANGIKLGSASADSPKGNPVNVTHTADNSVPKGMQRVVIRANPIPDTVVTTAVSSGANETPKSGQPAQSTQASTGAIRDVTQDAVKGCRLLGDVAGSDAIFVGLSASYGSKRAKEKALNQAAALGADSIAWSQRGTSMTNEWVGQAYVCGTSKSGASVSATSNAASSPQAVPAASSGGVVEANQDGVKSCKMLGDIAGSDAIFVGLSASYGSRRAKEKAMNQAIELGADTVAWSQRGTSMTNEWVGKAFRCKR